MYKDTSIEENLEDIRNLVEDVKYFRMDSPLTHVDAHNVRIQPDLWSALVLDHKLFGAVLPNKAIEQAYKHLTVDEEGVVDHDCVSRSGESA